MNPDYGTRLLQWLPAHWRERDQGDLAKLLGVYGQLLDALHATIEQRHDDSFPDIDPQGGHCQPWLLPYFAQLLDVQLVSPDEDGRRAELADAVAWRQRKGSLPTIEAIAEAIGRVEVETQEGWKRVAITPRVDRALLPESVYGEVTIASPASVDQRASHPGLPAVTLDLRRCSRAVQCDAANPAADVSNFAGVPLAWRQFNRHGIPCAADSYQDVSRRTLDLRTPDWRRGHYHPRRVLLYFPPPFGFFAPNHESITWASIANAVAQALSDLQGTWPADKTETRQFGAISLELSRGQWNGSELPRLSLRAHTTAPLRVNGVVDLNQTALYRFDNLWFEHKLDIAAGAVQASACAFRELHVATAERDAAVIDVRACLFDKLRAPRGLVQLEYATVLTQLIAECLRASDCILLARLRKDLLDNPLPEQPDVPAAGCIRFSQLWYIPTPADPEAPDFINDVNWVADHQRSALTVAAANCSTVAPLFWSDEFGNPGCAVLHPDCNMAIQSGAEDGGEMGACHDWRHVLRQGAVLDKLQEFLPVGMEAVLIADATLTCAPPRVVP